MDEFTVGSHLVSQRHKLGLPVYTHHGIYIGDNRVIHYAGNSGREDADGNRLDLIEVVSLEQFKNGQNTWVQKHRKPLCIEKVLARAKSRVGENGYSVFGNNCEHFCNWAIDDDRSSAQIDRIVAVTSPIGGGTLGLAATAGITGIGTAAELAGGAAMMKGMATLGVVGGAVGGVALSGLAAGATAATVLNATILKNVKDEAGRPDIGNEIKEENAARAIGRASSFAGAASGAAATVGIISAAGIPGLSAVGITSGLAAIGSTVTLGVGGMATGIVIGVAAPAVVAVAAGIGAHKLAQNNETVREGLTKAGDVIGATSDLAKRGLQSFLGSVEAGAAALKKKLDGSDQD